MIHEAATTKQKLLAAKLLQILFNGFHFPAAGPIQVHFQSNFMSGPLVGIYELHDSIEHPARWRAQSGRRSVKRSHPG